jgi:hypothetical protein
MDIASVIDKIKKLQALASNNANCNESYAATKAAEKLIQEHRVSQAQLEASGTIKAESFVREPVWIGGKRSSWRERIVSELASGYCAAWYIMHPDGKVAYVVCAKESDAKVLAYMFEYCTQEGERLSKQESKGQGVAFAKSFLEGYSIGLVEQLKKARLEEKAAKATADALMSAIGKDAPTTSAMVLLDTRRQEAKAYMYQQCGRMSSAGGLRGSHGNYDGREAGINAGRSVSLRKGMNGSSKPNGLGS